MKTNKFLATTIKDYLKEHKSFILNDEFWKWFNDSKVVNRNGEPLIVYHGTRVNFNIFKPSKNVGNQGETDQIEGIYFTDNKDGASFFSLIDDDKYLKSCFLSIKNPYFVVDNKTLKSNLNINDFKNVNKILKNMGYDGLIMERGFYAMGGPYTLYLAFYSNQIKSINNDGTWDINDNNIYS